MENSIFHFEVLYCVRKKIRVSMSFYQIGSLTTQDIFKKI